MAAISNRSVLAVDEIVFVQLEKCICSDAYDPLKEGMRPIDNTGKGLSPLFNAPDLQQGEGDNEGQEIGFLSP